MIYDRTVHPRVLDLAPRRAERIDVGRPAREATDQDAISFLLAEKARDGKVVARLKQGDPFLFDRGGEEALFLHEQGIPFEVVPGVPVRLGAAAYAGIPLTYPGGGDTLTLVRGHEAGTGEQVDGQPGRSLANSTAPSLCYGGRDRAAPRGQRAAGPRPPRRRPRRPHQPRHARRASRPWPAPLGELAARLGPTAPTARPRSSSARSSGCASTCAGSISGRCSAGACW